MPPLQTRKKSPIGTIMAFFFGLLILVATLEILLRLSMPHWKEFSDSRFLTHIFVEDHGLLMIGKPGFSGYFAQNNGDFRVQLRINEAGLRNSEPIKKSDSQIWAFGDSMTFGYGVEGSETYPESLQTITNFPVYNFSMPGGDICAFQTMSYRIGRTLQPKAVVLGLLIENDIRKYDCAEQFATQGGKKRAKKETSKSLDCKGCLNQLKGMLMEYSAFYNFFALNVKRVPLLKNALKSIGLIAQEHEKRGQPPKEKISELTESTVSEILRLRNHFSPGTPFVVLLIPARHDLKDGDEFYKNIRESLGQILNNNKVSFVDPYFNLQQVGFKMVHFKHDGHWTRVGHKIAAKVLAEWFKVNNIVTQ